MNINNNTTIRGRDIFFLTSCLLNSILTFPWYNVLLHHHTVSCEIDLDKPEWLNFRDNLI